MATLEVRLAWSHHPNRLRLRQRFTLERTEPCANATARERAAREGICSYCQGLRRSLQLNFFRSVSRQESNPWGSVLRVICVAIEQSYNRGCTVAQWLRRSLLKRRAPHGLLSDTGLRRLIRHGDSRGTPGLVSSS